MSQVKFTTNYDGNNVEVVGGYDRPLDYYHMTIYNLDEDDDVIFCNLDNIISMPKYADYYKVLLIDMGIDTPDGFWERCARKEGNVIYSFRDNEWHRA